MKSLRILPKPDWVSWDEITAVLHDAHKSTVANGMNYLASRQDPSETKKRAQNGVCYVALVNKRVVGTMTVRKCGPGGKWYTGGVTMLHMG